MLRPQQDSYTGTQTLSDFESEIAQLVFAIFLHFLVIEDGEAQRGH